MNLTKSSRRRSMVVAAVLSVLMVCVQSATAQTGKTITLRSFTYEQTINTTGRLRPGRNLVIKSKLSETVESLPVKEGQPVEKNERLLQFDTRTHSIRLNRTRHRMKRARHQREISRKTFERKKSLRKRDLVSESEYDQAELEYKQARENFSIARSDYNDARRQYDYTSVEAPFAGILDQHYVEIGEQVRRGQSLLQLLQLDPLNVAFEVTPEERDHLQQGDTVFVSLQSGTRPATVTQLSHDASQRNGLYSITARLSNPDRRLIAGRTVNLSIPLHSVEDAVRIPLNYIDRSSENARIILSDPGSDTLHERRLEVLDYADDHVVTRRTWPASWRLVPGSVYTKTGS